METILLCCAAVQILLLFLIVRRLKGQAFGHVGFLFMLASFVYHAFTEVCQILFPGRNLFRPLTEPWALEAFAALVTLAMGLFTAAYLYAIRPHRGIPSWRQVTAQLDTRLFLKWHVLLLIGLGSLILVGTRDRGTVGYWAGGLSDQFTVYLFPLAFSILALRNGGRRFVVLCCILGLVVSTFGSRTVVVETALLTLSTLVRYGVRVPRRTLLGTAVVLVFCGIAISASRAAYGRFISGEDFTTRIQTLFSSSTAEGASSEGLLNDFIYRLDGNSFGAMILARQVEGFGVTGLHQAFLTVSYLVPSFIYTSKLQGDLSLHNEKEYTTQFYSFSEEYDYIPGMWPLILGYAGPIGLLMCALSAGGLTALFDNWLMRCQTVTAYLGGIFATTVVMNYEQGPVGILYILRGFSVIYLFALIRYRKTKPDDSIVALRLTPVHR